MLRLVAFLAAAAVLRAQDPAAASGARSWQPVAGHLQTKWAADVTPLNAWPEHPRPLQRRSNWKSQNGLWDYAITAADAPMPEHWDGAILVPFALEAALSGVGRQLQAEQTLWYRRVLQLPARDADRFLLHFDAVDHACTVTVDGKVVGEHRGGYDPFVFDITAALGRSKEHTVVVAVRDPSDAGAQPRGKQVQKPGGIWYTPVSGIWQTVWLEGVPDCHVTDIDVRGDRVTGALRIAAEITGDGQGLEWQARVFDKAQIVVEGNAAIGQPIELKLPQPRAWSPQDPFRYGLQVRTVTRGVDDSSIPRDWVDSYFALRDISLGHDEHGNARIELNGEPVFQFGPLDQGYWPDGLYTPPTLAAMCSDLDAIARMGCNMLRKHVKVECERYYEECDKRGILVWQDMPSGDAQKDPAGFERELRALIAARRRHPCIVTWVVFNEGWGQHDTQRYVDLVRSLDATRLIGNASGWTDQHCGDLVDAHVYPGPGMPRPEPARAAVLGEFGGLGLPLPGHTWVDKDNWGYVRFPDQASLTDAYVARVLQLRPLIAQGLCAAVYTQTTDVEIEVNGWLTYDRAVPKIDPLRAAEAARRLYGQRGTLRTLVATAPDPAATWRYTITAPADGWQRMSFDDTAWSTGPAGFGTAGTPGARVGTRWDGPSIWLRRAVDLPAGELREPFWLVHHDEDVELFVDGTRVLAARGYTTDYEYAPVDAAARALLTPGRHVLAVSCKQTGGGQFIDVGFVDVIEK